MFESFSSGYYLGRLYVEPHDGEHAVMSRDEHESVNQALYSSGEGVERLDWPLVMKIDQQHFPVHAEEGVPENTLALPDTVLENTRIRNPPELKEVLLAKADRAEQLIRYQREHPGFGNTGAV
ncbi:hypothetical protein BG842_22035 [Haladaptatus sp. W1]|uniref:DUF5802 family protein n=1 Tax=unclassified Haladaptatus TaxID=2622732 RepID=UPI000849A3D4|nr:MULTISPECIES: DUF5802 family protein [unclassified Haladaptatus]ODR81857.1 hypothetical protein BG842_26665 [Haladaptatus sp. W1]ODR82996.1 hypothetical protein BG842_22035 [Haladaptatus sp. W1]GKZ13088.1 hypothetical protein HAL_09690 [Haladaptatus sp. T7]